MLAAVAAALLAACGGAGPEAIPTGSAGGKAPPASATSDPTPKPSPAEGWTGTATLELRGGVEAHRVLPIVFGTVSLDPSELVVAWSDPDGGYALAVLWSGTAAPEARVPLEGALLTISTPETGGFGTYTDTRGACVTTLVTFRPDRMAGTFRCPELRLPDRSLPDVQATGSFRVRRTG
jgi:hypothetical protein